MQNYFREKYKLLIEQDKERGGSYQRYPVRFVFFSDAKTYKEGVTYFIESGCIINDLASLLKSDDGWINSTMILNYIKSINGCKDMIILGFSEIVRFYKRAELETLINSLLTDIENNSQKREKRIYILCYGLYNIIDSICKERYRRLDVLNPLIAPEEQVKDLNMKLYFTQNEIIEKIAKYQVKTVKEWLTVQGRENLGNSLICTSNTLNFWYENAKPDTLFHIEKLETEKDIIEKVLQVAIPFEFSQKERSYWIKLLLEIYANSGKNFLQILQVIFDVNNILNPDIVKMWFEANCKWKKWLLRQFVISYNCNSVDDYTMQVLKSLDSIEDSNFLRSAWLLIFDNTDAPEEWYLQRKTLVKRIAHFYQKHEFIEFDLIKEINQIKDIKILVQIITGVTKVEKKRVIELFKEDKISNEQIATVYPELWAYLNHKIHADNDMNVEWIEQYFDKYREAKLRDEYTEHLKSALKKVNNSSESFFRWYYSIPKVKDILTEEKIDRIILLDGIGVEWILLLIKLLEDRNIFIDKTYFAGCELPSITRLNKLFESPTEKVGEFDKNVIHTNDYIYPETIVKAIDTIKEIVDEKIVIVENERVAIISDHGSTIIHRLAKNDKVYDYQKSEHGGRCMEYCADSIKDNEDLFVYKDGDRKWVMALHSVSLCKRARSEVHGGATPEEVVVPVLIVSKTENQSIYYRIKANNLKITGLNKNISFIIKPKPKTQPILEDEFGKRYELQEINGVWETELEKVKKQKVLITIGEQKEGFDIKTSFEEGELF